MSASGCTEIVNAMEESTTNSVEKYINGSQTIFF